MSPSPGTQNYQELKTMLNVYASLLTSLRPYLVPGFRVIIGQVAPNFSNTAAKPAFQPFRSPYDDPGMDQGDRYIQTEPTDLYNLEFFSWYIWIGIPLLPALKAVTVGS